jgi:hypothetical protein
MRIWGARLRRCGKAEPEPEAGRGACEGIRPRLGLSSDGQCLTFTQGPSGSVSVSIRSWFGPQSVSILLSIVPPTMVHRASHLAPRASRILHALAHHASCTALSSLLVPHQPFHCQSPCAPCAPSRRPPTSTGTNAHTHTRARRHGRTIPESQNAVHVQLNDRPTQVLACSVGAAGTDSEPLGPNRN